MTNLLLRIFAPGDDRSAVGRLSGLVGIGCNLLLFAGKLLMGTISGSVAITADALNNLSDASSSIVTFLGFKLSEKPADEGHPYGHARYEYLTALAVAVMILFIGFELLKTSLGKILVPAPTEFSVPVVVVLVGSIAVKLWLCRFNTVLGTRIGSKALLATAADSRNDCVATAAVLLAALIEALTQWRTDGFMGLGVAVFILYSGVNLARETIDPLLGENASPELRKLIIDTVRGEKAVLGYHDLMVHDYGPGQRYASLHVEMDYRWDPMKCHSIIDDLERKCLREHNVHLVIHYDPVVVGDAELDAMRLQVEKVLKEMDQRLSVHDFRMVKSEAHIKLVFDMAVPQELMGQKNAIKETLDGKLSELCGQKIYTAVTFDLKT